MPEPAAAAAAAATSVGSDNVSTLLVDIVGVERVLCKDGLVLGSVLYGISIGRVLDVSSSNVCPLGLVVPLVQSPVRHVDGCQQGNTAEDEGGEEDGLEDIGRGADGRLATRVLHGVGLHEGEPGVDAPCICSAEALPEELGRHATRPDDGGDG